MRPDRRLGRTRDEQHLEHHVPEAELIDSRPGAAYIIPDR